MNYAPDIVLQKSFLNCLKFIFYAFESLVGVFSLILRSCSYGYTPHHKKIHPTILLKIGII